MPRNGYARLVASTTCASPLTSERLVPAVPHKSLDQLHAPYTPAAACPVIRFPTGLSQEIETPLVLTTSLWLTTRHRRFTFVRLSDPYLFEVRPRHFDSNAHHRRLLTAAAWSGLQPAPESRLRRALLHLLCSLCTVRQFISNFLSVRLRRTFDAPVLTRQVQQSCGIGRKRFQRGDAVHGLTGLFSAPTLRAFPVEHKGLRPNGFATLLAKRFPAR